MSKEVLLDKTDNTSLLDKFDDKFNLLYLMKPPYTTHLEVSYNIQIAIDKSEAFSERYSSKEENSNGDI